MFCLSKEPRIPNSCATNHCPIKSKRIFYEAHFLHCINITIAENRNFHALIVLYFFNQGPVCISFIQLCACATVNTYCCNSNILQPFSHFYHIFSVFVPAQSRFYSNRQRCALNNFRSHAHHFGNILKYGSTCTTTCNFFYRATIINIYQIRFGSLYNFHTIYHGINFSSEKLNANGALFIINIELHHTLLSMTD